MSEFSVALAAASRGQALCTRRENLWFCVVNRASEDGMESSHGILIIHLFSTIF